MATIEAGRRFVAAISGENNGAFKVARLKDPNHQLSGRTHLNYRDPVIKKAVCTTLDGGPSAESVLVGATSRMVGKVPSPWPPVGSTHLPPQKELLNYEVQEEKCCMCGPNFDATLKLSRHTGKSPFRVCSVCRSGSAFWGHSASGVYFKWCGDCNEFKLATEWGAGPDFKASASKCKQCRDRQSNEHSPAAQGKIAMPASWFLLTAHSSCIK